MEWFWVQVFTCLGHGRWGGVGRELWVRVQLGSWGAPREAGCPFWLPAHGRSTVEAPMAGGKGSPAPNICQGTAGARKYRPGVILPGHNVGRPQPTGSCLSVPLKGVTTAGPQQCTMPPSAPQGPDGIAGTQWRCDPLHAMLSPPNPPGTARLCGLLPPLPRAQQGLGRSVRS